jgi:hypothetical protein
MRKKILVVGIRKTLAFWLEIRKVRGATQAVMAGSVRRWEWSITKSSCSETHDVFKARFAIFS